MSEAGQPEVEPALVVDTVRQYWVRPQPAQRRHRVAPDEVDKVSRATLDTMITRRFRIGRKPSDEEYEQLLARVRHWVRRGRAIHVTLGYGPMKNPNTAPSSRADWADFFALCNLCDWHNKVLEVYPAGLRIKIIFDDSTAAMALRARRRQMKSYISSIQQLIDVLGFQSFIVGTMRQSWFAWLFHLGFYQVARRRVRCWEQDPDNQPVMQRMCEFARRNLPLPQEMDPNQQQRCCYEASHRFRVYWEALQLSGFSRIGHSLIAMYLDGTQHHIQQQTALHLHSLGKGQVTQPWQGEGALLDNGHGKLIPLVLTATRRETMIASDVEGLDVIPMAGFDRIRVCRKAA